MPLAMMNEGDKVRVMAVTGADGVRKHLGSLAIIPGAVLTVMHKAGENMILGVQDSRIAIGEDISHHVMVEAL